MEGAILISRALIDSEVFASEKLLKIWIWLLIKANYKERTIPVKIGNGQSTVNLKRGELLFGRLSAENDLFIDGSTIYKCIKKLESFGNITTKSNSHYTIISICNYDKYQDVKTYKVAAKEQPSNNQVTTEEQLRNIDNKDNKDNKVNKENNFISEVKMFSEYSPEMLDAFINYWCEHNQHGKMKWELEKTFEIKRRLITWKGFEDKKKQKAEKSW